MSTRNDAIDQTTEHMHQTTEFTIYLLPGEQSVLLSILNVNKNKRVSLQCFSYEKNKHTLHLHDYS